MAAKKSGKRRPTPRQMKLIEERAKGKSYAQAAEPLQATQRKTHASLAFRPCNSFMDAFQNFWIGTA
jgi:hypothetical protein